MLSGFSGLLDLHSVLARNDESDRGRGGVPVGEMNLYSWPQLSPTLYSLWRRKTNSGRGDKFTIREVS